MDGILMRAAAKINLFLEVTARRTDGYHDILSVMQSVSLCDELKLCLRGQGISLDCGDAPLDCGQKNLAYRAARLYLEHVGADCGVDIRLTKRIPMQAGLGGGSSDAAAVLLGLDRLLGQPLGLERLTCLGAALGADVPFCIMGGCARATGIGEQLESLPMLPECSIVICCPPERISTPGAYGELDRLHGGFAEGAYAPRSLDGMLSALGTSRLTDICGEMYNIFEDVTSSRDDIRSIKRCMTESGALAALLSGSGPSVFGIFENDKSARRCADVLGEQYADVYVCAPMSANKI